MGPRNPQENPRPQRPPRQNNVRPEAPPTMIPYIEPPIEGVMITHPDNSQQIAIPTGSRPTRPNQNHRRPDEPEPRPPQN